MKKNKGPFIPNQGQKILKPGTAVQNAQVQSAERLLLQFNDHVRNITKSLAAMGDINTLLYNELLARDNALKVNDAIKTAEVPKT